MLYTFAESNYIMQVNKNKENKVLKLKTVSTFINTCVTIAYQYRTLLHRIVVHLFCAGICTHASSNIMYGYISALLGFVLFRICLPGNVQERCDLIKHLSLRNASTLQKQKVQHKIPWELLQQPHMFLYGNLLCLPVHVCYMHTVYYVDVHLSCNVIVNKQKL